MIYTVTHDIQNEKSDQQKSGFLTKSTVSRSWNFHNTTTSLYNIVSVSLD